MKTIERKRSIALFHNLWVKKQGPGCHPRIRELIPNEIEPRSAGQPEACKGGDEVLRRRRGGLGLVLHLRNCSVAVVVLDNDLPGVVGAQGQAAY